jgi:hypothetical protein
MQNLVVQNPRVVEAAPLVAARAPEHRNLDSHVAADRASALLPRAGGKERVMLLDKVVVFTASFEKRAVGVDRLDNLLV